MRVQDLVQHILLHVEAELADNNPSQVVGIVARARYVRRMLRVFRMDQRDMTVGDLLGEISNASPPASSQASFKRALGDMVLTDETRPQLAIQEWVGKSKERRGG